MTPHWQKLLADRGILEQAQDAGWKPDGNGWSYPVAEGVSRWKAFDSHADPKYLWRGNSKLSKYYLLSDTVEAIIESAGLFIASGEPDVLTYRAAGIKNVICWYGESNVPQTLAADLVEWGVEWVRYYPDLDATGEGSAHKVCNLLSKTDIDVFVGKLPADLGDAGDINKLWIHCRFDADAFKHILESCPQIAFADLRQPLPDEPAQQDLPLEFYTAIEQALGVAGYEPDGWSKMVKCPLVNHEHDHERPAGAWHREKHIYYCQKCAANQNTGYVLARDIGAKLGIDYRQFLPKKQQKPTNGKRPGKKSNSIYSWGQATDSVVEEFIGNVDGSVYEPLPIPFQNLQEFGGLAKLAVPKKIIAVVADSGDGKTSFIETVLDSWRKLGFSGIMFGPEWSKEEMVYRAIQRAGGPTYMQVVEHRAWYAAYKRGMPEDERPGKPLSDVDSDKGVNLAEEIRGWPGKLWFVEEMSIMLDDLLGRMDEIIAGAAAEGVRIAYAVWDYAQLLRVTTGGVDSALARVKGFCVDRNLIGVVASQVPKEVGRDVAAGKGKLDHHAMQFARSDYFNLVLTINREIDADAKKSPIATIVVAKNSLGQTGETKLAQSEERLLWGDMKKSSLDLTAF